MRWQPWRQRGDLSSSSQAWVIEEGLLALLSLHLFGPRGHFVTGRHLNPIKLMPFGIVTCYRALEPVQNINNTYKNHIAYLWEKCDGSELS